ncbi:hypothetical protein EEJ42_16585 [Streptomyces botrytidirepellens]|uniref:Uncharacterized protein n=1 Tax=Streptomyces botrytidirepellens TaxID=2486417 RepID=A0A3M8WDD6_9ACTN|nr:hypothetical protein EEJ42_16585 [Streptomyces botrytidirepellens]
MPCPPPRPYPTRGSAPDPAPQTPEGLECTPGGAELVVGNRSAEGAPPSGSWGRNGWAHPGHRPAPGDETPGATRRSRTSPGGRPRYGVRGGAPVSGRGGVGASPGRPPRTCATPP